MPIKVRCFEFGVIGTALHPKYLLMYPFLGHIRFLHELCRKWSIQTVAQATCKSFHIAAMSVLSGLLCKHSRSRKCPITDASLSDGDKTSFSLCSFATYRDLKKCFELAQKCARLTFTTPNNLGYRNRCKRVAVLIHPAASSRC